MKSTRDSSSDLAEDANLPLGGQGSQKPVSHSEDDSVGGGQSESHAPANSKQVTVLESRDGETVGWVRRGQPSRSSQSTPEDDNGLWSSLRHPVFRFLWVASIFSNLGTWVHEVGSSWMMTELDPAPEMVSAVRVAMSAPMMLLAIPAGLLADRIDRRRLLIGTDVFLLVTAAILSLGCYAELIRSWSLLGLTLMMGMGMVVHVLAWQSSIPELVPRWQLPHAIALGSLSFNLARAAGPAAGGLMIAYAGTWLTFAVNALSYAVVLVALLRWQRPATVQVDRPSMGSLIRSGASFIRGNRPLCHCYLRLSFFLLPASALWALLPLVIRVRLQWGERGFGFMVTLIGIGAVIAASQLHRIHQRLGTTKTLLAAKFTASIALGGFALATDGWLASACVLILGASWMTVLTTLNSATQMNLNQEFRARGMSVYYVTMASCMAIGSFVWGQVAGSSQLAIAIFAAAAMMLLGAWAGNRFEVDP